MITLFHLLNEEAVGKPCVSSSPQTANFGFCQAAPLEVVHKGQGPRPKVGCRLGGAGRRRFDHLDGLTGF